MKRQDKSKEAGNQGREKNPTDSGSHLELENGKIKQDEGHDFSYNTLLKLLNVEKMSIIVKVVKSSQKAIFTTMSGYGKIPQKALLL